MSEPARLPVTSADGHSFELLACIPRKAHSNLLWLPALGVQARHYIPFSQALAAQGIAVFLHEWRGNGSSNLRPSHQMDWGYRELLQFDLPASITAMQVHTQQTPCILGGHSLGGQLSCCFAAMHPSLFQTLWLVASGTPWWKSFPAPRRYFLPLIYRFLPWLAQRQGALHGRKIGFGGKESRGLIKDWARVGLSNHYMANDLPLDIEAAMRRVDISVVGIVFEDDWLAPHSSMHALLSKLASANHVIHRMDKTQLGVAADHFAWMKSPEKLVRMLCCKK